MMGLDTVFDFPTDMIEYVREQLDALKHPPAVSRLSENNDTAVNDDTNSAGVTQSSDANAMLLEESSASACRGRSRCCESDGCLHCRGIVVGGIISVVATVGVFPCAWRSCHGTRDDNHNADTDSSCQVFGTDTHAPDQRGWQQQSRGPAASPRRGCPDGCHQGCCGNIARWHHHASRQL